MTHSRDGGQLGEPCDGTRPQHAQPARDREGVGRPSLHPQGRPCGRPPAALGPGDDTTVTWVPTPPSTPGGTKLPGKERLPRRSLEGQIAILPGLMQGSIPAGLVLIIELMLRTTATSAPKPGPHTSDPVQHGQPPLLSPPHFPPCQRQQQAQRRTLQPGVPKRSGCASRVALGRRGLSQVAVRHRR
jgi:hypothetical protein